MFEREGLSLLNPPDQYPGLLNPTGQNIQGPGHRSPFQFLSLPGTAGNYASTPDSAAVSITGDIDIRVKVAADDWTPPSFATFLSKVDVPNFPTWSYRFSLQTGGELRFSWGTASAVIEIPSTVSVGATDGAIKWVRATLDVDNGAAGNDVKFYTSDDGVTWVQLGTTVTTAGVTSIQDTVAAVDVGARDGAESWSGKVYYAEIRNGIDGTVVAKFDPANDARTGPDSFTSSTGEVWTVNKSGSPSAQLV